jgi:hypothetical protein
MKNDNKMIWAALGLAIAGIAAACSDSKKDTPSNDIIVGDGGESSTGTGGKSSKGGATGSGGETASGGTSETTGAAGSTTSSSGGASVGTAGATSLAGGASIAGATGVAGSSGDCVGVANNGDPTKKCYKCAPTTSVQVLTACTDVTCVPFDNSKLTKMVNGALPALP